jgi:thioredoxin-like negative regulator of GroEL
MDFFDQEKRRQRAVLKAGNKLASNISTPEARQKAVELLAGLGTEEAISMLLRRFTTRVTSEIADRDEKEHVLKLVVDSGPRALGPICEYLKREDEIRFALTALSELAPGEECTRIVLSLLESMGVPLPRQRSKVLQLLQFLEEHRDSRITPAVLPFLRDAGNDDLRVAAALVLGEQEETDEARTALLDALVGEEESQRLRNAIIEIFADNGWGVQGYRKKVEAVLPEGYAVDRSGAIRRRGQEIER